MPKIDPIVTGIVVVTLLIFGGILIVAVFFQPPSIIQYSSESPDRPKLTINETVFDFGKMKTSDIKTQEITLKNEGNRPLILSDFSTSCDCTFIQLFTSQQNSPRFSMGRSSWRGEIAPGETARLKLTYEPKIMPVKGAVRREAVFRANDPERRLTNLRFNAIVE